MKTNKQIIESFMNESLKADELIAKYQKAAQEAPMATIKSNYLDAIEKVKKLKTYIGKKISSNDGEKIISGTVIDVEQKGLSDSTLVVRWNNGTVGGGFWPYDLGLVKSKYEI